MSARVDTCVPELLSSWLDISSSRLVQTIVMPADFDQSISRSATPCAVSSFLPVFDSIDTGSMTTQRALCSVASALMRTRKVSALPVIVRADTMRRIPLLTCGASRMPTDERLRMISAPSESKLTNSVLSLRLHAASAKAPLKVVLAVPGKPVMSTVAARK